MELAQSDILADGGVPLVTGLAIFAVAALAMSLGALLFGWFIRQRSPHPVKEQPYECGEVAIGEGWVQFDLRFYVVALVFLIFDVETALFYPWAVVWGKLAQSARFTAAMDMLFFFVVIGVGFVYLWRFGYLDWVRAITGASDREHAAAPQTTATTWPASSPEAAVMTWSAPPPPVESMATVAAKGGINRDV